MNVATGWLRVLQNENPNRRYQLLRLQDRFERPALELCGVVARVAMAQTQERELFEANGYLNIPRWTYESEMTRSNTSSEDLLTFDTTVLQDITSDHSIRVGISLFHFTDHSQKRKLNSGDANKQSTETVDTSRPSAVFTPTKGRKHTLSLALPGSIIAK
jgi:hypothetical protein